MEKKISRRGALVAGTAAAGFLAGSSGLEVRAKTLPQQWGGDFLMPWSPTGSTQKKLTPGNTPVRLSCSSYCLHYTQGMDIAESVQSIKNAGYTAAEGNDNWKHATDSEIRELNQVLKEKDLLFYTIHVCINNIHPDLTERRKINKRVAENVEAAERLGLSFIVTHTGSCADRATLPHRDNWTKETWDTSVKAIKQILNDTSGSKVSLGIEALNPCNINNPWAHVRLREDVGDPRCKVTLDPANMINLGTYFRSTELINESFDLLGENIVVADAKSNYILPDKMSAYITQVPLYKGILDYETYLVRLSRLKYPRTLLIEAHAEEEYPAAKKFIEETAANVGVTIYS